MLVYASAIFLSAVLLFLVQPLTGKLLLPMLGGSPSVWNTCMVFFQALLLLGYGYSHFLSKLRSLAAQSAIHIGVLIAAWLMLPIRLHDQTPSEIEPTQWLLVELLRIVGVPFFCVATTGPLVQRWFSRTNHSRATDPYFLYAASNVGSAIGLLAYPLALEPFLTRQQQSAVWTVGFGVLSLLLLMSAVHAMRTQSSVVGSGEEAAAEEIGWGRRARWVLLAFVPSSLMIGVTQTLSTDVAAVPLLWVAPLLLYLLSFVVAFSHVSWISGRVLGRLAPLTVLPLLVVMLTQAKHPMVPIVLIHLAAFSVSATMCHRLMAEDRPGVRRLTEFYLWMSVGGVLGGVLNALVAPVVFDLVVEYPLVLGIACFLRPQTFEDLAYWRERWGVKALLLVLGCAVVAVVSLVAADVAVMQGWTLKMAAALGTQETTAVGIIRGGLPATLVCMALLWRGSVRFGVMATILMLGSLFTAVGGPVLHRERTFFGVHRVTQNPDATWTVLHHGTTLHGVQIKSENLPPPPEGLPPITPETLDKLFFGHRQAFTRNQRIAMSHLIPSTYYHPTGPIGDVFKTFGARVKSAAFIGMGTGSLAAYGRPGMAFDFFEIDPAVVRIASTPEFFSYLSNSKADQGRAIFGDGRVQIARQPDAGYDLIVIDAFSSDAIPVHLVTHEAMKIYCDKLRKGGIIAFHISNRYFDLKPVLARLAALHGWEAFSRDDSAIMSEDAAEAKKDSLWVIVCENASAFGLANTPNWPRLSDRKEYPTWTDDYSNVLSVFVGW